MNSLINKYYTKGEIRFSIIITSIFLILLIFQNINGRFWMNDFKVFYSAADAFVHGEPVYFKQFGLSSGYYKYSPVSLLLFVPFAMLPYFYAKLIYYLLCTYLISVVLIRSKNIWNPPENNRQESIFVLIIAALVSGSHLFREMHLGNINLVLLFALLYSLKLIIKEKEVSGGLLLSLIFLIKPHFIVLIPLLIIRKKFKSLIWIITGLAVGLLLPAAFVGITKNIDLLSEWFSTIAMHNSSFLESQNTIHIILYNIIIKYIYPDAGSVYVLSMIFIIAILILVLIIRDLRSEKISNNKEYKNRNITFEYVLIMSVVPNLVLTDTEHFMLSLPLILFLLTILFQSGNIYLWVISIFGLLLYIGNWGDILGKYSSIISSFGILGIGNIFIIIMSTYLFIMHTNKIRMENQGKR